MQFEIEQPDLSAFLTTYLDGRWVLMLNDDRSRDEDAQRTVIRQAIGRSDIDIELCTTGRWEVAALIADQFRVGRVFLTGDAAHQLPPNRGGYGANTGIEDAHNLAWKLAAVLSGRSTPELLDTYDAERRPIAWLRHEQIFARADYKTRLKTAVADVPIIDDDAMELGQLYRSTAVLGAGPELPRALRPDHWAGQPGTRAPHLRVLIEGTERSTLNLLQHGWVLLSEDQGWQNAAAQAAAELGVDITFVHIGTDAKPTASLAFQTACVSGFGGQPAGRLHRVACRRRPGQPRPGADHRPRSRFLRPNRQRPKGLGRRRNRRGRGRPIPGRRRPVQRIVPRRQRRPALGGPRWRCCLGPRGVHGNVSGRQRRRWTGSWRRRGPHRHLVG